MDGIYFRWSLLFYTQNVISKVVTVDCVWRKGKHLQHMNIVSDENLSRIFYVVNRQDVNGIQFLEYKKGYVVLPEFIKYEFVEFTRCDWSDVASFFRRTRPECCGNILWIKLHILFIIFGCLSHILRSSLNYFLFFFSVVRSEFRTQNEFPPFWLV